MKCELYSFLHSLLLSLVVADLFALSLFPSPSKVTSAVKIVYSTCSIHAEEDELVVLAALESAEAKTGGWKLAGREEVLPTWERRGTKEVMGKKGELWLIGSICSRLWLTCSEPFISASITLRGSASLRARDG